MTLYVAILISVMALCYADTIHLSTVAIGTQCSFYLRLLTFVMVFLVHISPTYFYISPMILHCHVKS